VRETDRIEQRSRFRELLPWLLIALLGVILIAGILIWYVTKSDSKSVPTVIGLRVDNAVTRMQDNGFKVQIARQSNARAVGVVFGQNPGGGTSADKGSTVHLLVSNGRSRKTVPNAVGLAQAAARDVLVQAGFSVTTVEISSDQPNGMVVAQDPAAGTRVAPGTKVRINVSKGSADVAVPSEVGSTVDDAKARMVVAGFLLALVALVALLLWWLRHRARRAGDGWGPLRAVNRPLPPVLAAFDRGQEQILFGAIEPKEVRLRDADALCYGFRRRAV